jgi:hypothetical protein
MEPCGITHDSRTDDRALEGLRHAVHHAHLDEVDPRIATGKRDAHGRDQAQHQAQVGNDVEDRDDRTQEERRRENPVMRRPTVVRSPDAERDGHLPPEVGGQETVVFPETLPHTISALEG